MAEVKISDLTENTTPTDATVVEVEAVSSGKMTLLVIWGYIWGKVTGSYAKAAPVDADSVALVDSEDSSATKRLTWSVIKATLKTYFDSIYFLQSNVIDEDDMASDSDTKVPTQQSVKYYVDNKEIAASNIDLDGATDIGADLVDADLLLVDDGASGTNRKSAISRVWTYISAKIDSLFFATETLTSSSGTVSVDLTKKVGKLTLTENTSVNFPSLAGLTAGRMYYYHLRVTGASTYTLAFNPSFDSGDPAPDLTMTAGATNDYVLIIDVSAATITVVSAQVGAS